LSYLIDTNVLSEIRRKTPDVNVLEWVDENEQALRRQLAGDFFQFLSAVKKYDFGSAAALLGPQLELPAGERS